MEFSEIAASGYAGAAFFFALLSAMILSRWNDRPKSGLLAIACGATTFWAGIYAVTGLGYIDSSATLLFAEVLRNLTWLAAVLSIYKEMDEADEIQRFTSRFAMPFLALSAGIVIYFFVRVDQVGSSELIVINGVILSSITLIVVEQIYRNAPFDAQSGLKYLCVGVAGLCVYDFLIFTLAIVRLDVDANQVAARGFVNAGFAAPLALAVQRSFRMSLDSHLPRQIVLYSFAGIAAGLFIIFAVMGDYYVSTYAGTWAGVARIVFFVALIFALALLMVSATIRARVRVFVMKTFFQYKYDYRKEWLRFIGTLSQSDLENVATTATRAVAQIVNSPAGIVWVIDEGGDYLPVGAWECEVPVMSSVDAGDALIQFLNRRQWVMDLNEMRSHPARYEDLTLNPWVEEQSDWWLIVPLFLGNKLFGFMVLLKPRIVRSLNFEDHDLLRTVGRHVATHIDQAESDRRLAESSQFGTYNRLTAFLMHDLNNLIAQQSLVVKNAEKFRHNPKFVDDAIDTIAHSVSRMRRLMEQLSSRSSQPVRRRLVLADVIEDVMRRVAPRCPVPTYHSNNQDIAVEADNERLTTVFEHLVRNAQDSTDDDGEIRIDALIEGDVVVVRISDNGVGMTPEFVRNRLFRPFDSTKGSQSMGIGAYQAREYIRELGGQLSVRSALGEGTTFTIRLPHLQKDHSA